MGTKITNLTALATAPDTLDVIAIVDVDDPAHAPSGTTKKITIADLGFLATGADISLLNNDSGFITVSDFANNGENAGADRDLGNLDAFALSFITSGVGRINIEAGGNVGIGTSTPTEKLEIVGNAKITGGIDVDNSTFLVNSTTHGFSLGYLATPDTAKEAVTIGASANTLTSGRSIAIGYQASAVASGATSNIAIGYQAKAPSGDNVISIGDQSGSTIVSNGSQTILIGYLAGNQSTTIGTQTVAIGDQTDATGIQATLLGSQAQAAANWAIAVGWDSRSNFISGIAIGLRAETGAARAYVMGSGVTNPPVNSVADSFGIGFDEAAANNIRFRFSKTADSYLNGTGNVGIGTTTPTDTLQVVGNVNATRYKVNGVAGANFSGVVTSITVVDGLVTAVS